MTTRLHVLLAFLLLLCGVLRPLHAGGGPGEVVLVVNADSPASLTVANAWIAARGLDPSHVIALRGISSHERITVEEFRGRILLPVITEMERRGLAAQIQWIVYSADLPTAADFSADLVRPPPYVVGRWGSLTGLTVLAPLVVARDTAYCLSRAANPYYRMNDLELKQRWDVLPEAIQERWNESMKLYRSKDYAKAAALLAPLVAATGDPSLAYDYACDLAMAGDATAAMAALETAEKGGWTDFRHTQADSDLVSLRELPAFKALIRRLSELAHPAPDTVAWDRRLARLADGRTALAERPVAGWLSTMLAVTSGRGLSVREALQVIARARSADGVRPGGTICLMRNGDVRSTTRQWAFRGVVSAIEGLGAQAAIVDGVLPDGRADVAGLVAGSATFDWPKSGAVMLPGAIAEHLTSCGGMMGWGDGQTPLTEFLRRGAAGSSGTVEEPYALQYKFPSPFIQVHYRRGATLGEAFYQSLANPYHLLVVGDPLCAPWADPPAWRVTPPAIRDGRLELAADRAGGEPALAEIRVLVDGVQAWRGAPGPVAIPVQAWPAGPHRIEVVGVAEGPLATQVRAAFAVESGVPAVLACARAQVPLDGAVAIAWGAPAGAVGVITHLGRDLAAQPGGRSRQLSVPAVALGMGRSVLQAEVRDAVGRVLARSRPVEVDITAPALLAALPEPAGVLAGVRLIPFDQESPGVVAAKGRMEGDWLAGCLGAEKARGPVMAGWWLRAGAGDDLAQIQIRTQQRGFRLVIDGEPVAMLGADGWRFALVRLAPGWHRIHLDLDAGDARVEVRIGVAGTAPVAIESCRCPPPATAGREEDEPEAAAAATSASSPAP